MRMWMVPTNIMCRNHLLGEHVEIHMLVGTINKKGNVTGYINSGLLEFKSLKCRHDELIKEMTRRGYKHNSPLPDILFEIENKKVNVEENIKELCRRCDKCRELYFKESLER